MKSSFIKAGTLLSIAVFALPLSSLAASVPSTGGSSTDGSVSDSSSSSAPATGGSSTDGSVSDSSSSSAPATGGGSTNGAVTGPSSPSTPANTGGGSGSTSSSGSSVGGFSVVQLAASTTAATTSCPLITVALLQQGRVNDPTEVSKLQAFLKDSQGLNLTVNGVYDQATEQAVAAFQAKYLSDIMGPWDATRPSGIAYITTLKKINELACKEPLTLTPQESAVIEAYKNAIANGQTGSTMVQTGTSNAASPVSATGTAPLVGPVIGQTQGSNPNVAAVVVSGAQSVLGNIWNFIVHLFHR